MAYRYHFPDFDFDHMDILRDVDQAIGVANSVARQCEREARAMERSYQRMGDQIMRDVRHNLQSIWSDIAHHFDDDFEDFIRPCAPPRQNFYPRRNNRRNANAFRRDHQRSPRRQNSGSQEPRTSPVTTQQSETNGNNEVCAVCQEQLLPSQEDWFLPCVHKFHARCLRPWLRRNRTCPVCRHPVSFED